MRTIRWRLLAIMLYFFGFGFAAEKALAQQMPQPSPQDQVQALSGQLIDEMQQVLQWRTRALADEARIAELQADLAKKK